MLLCCEDTARDPTYFINKALFMSSCWVCFVALISGRETSLDYVFSVPGGANCFPKPKL